MYKFVMKYESTLDGSDKVFSCNTAFEADSITEAEEFAYRFQVPTCYHLYISYNGRLIDTSILEFICDSYLSVLRITKDADLANKHLFDTSFVVALKDAEYYSDLINAVKELYLNKNIKYI